VLADDVGAQTRLTEWTAAEEEIRIST
jgi:hypothetical protein